MIFLPNVAKEFGESEEGETSACVRGGERRKQALNHFVEHVPDLTCGRRAHTAGAPREGKKHPPTEEPVQHSSSLAGLRQAERGGGGVGALPVGRAGLPAGAGDSQRSYGDAHGGGRLSVVRGRRSARLR
jgi:hypothetical protein